MDHEKPEMKSEKEGMEDLRVDEDNSDRLTIEEEHIDTNPENEPRKAQQPFFVADTGDLEDNESMIIPSSQAEDSELMIPSTPACADTSDKKFEEIDPNESTVSVLEETCIDLEEKAGPIKPSKELSNQAACTESDMTQDLSELQPTQPIVASNIEIDHPFNKSPVDSKKKIEEEDEEDSWHLKFSETQTQDLIGFQKDEEPELKTFELPKKPEIEAEVDDDDDDLPATLSIEVPPRIDVEGDYYKLKDKEFESSKQVESVEAEEESEDEIEPSQSCLSEYKGETISLSYKVQSNIDASNNEPSNEDIPKLSSENNTKINEDIDNIDSEKRTINLTESESVNVIEEIKYTLGDRTLSIEELPIDGVEDKKDKDPSNISNKKKTEDSEIVVEELIEEKPAKKSCEYPLKFYEEEVVKIKEINGNQIEEITLSEISKDEKTPQENEESESITTDMLENSSGHNNKKPAENLKLSSKVSQDIVEIENNVETKECDGKSKNQEKSIKNKYCESEEIKIDHVEKKSEVSKQDLNEKTEISSVESQQKSDVEPNIVEKVDKKKDLEIATAEGTNPELDANKLSGDNLQQNIKQTIDESMETPPKTFALPSIPDKSLASSKKQKVQNTSYQDPSIVERYDKKLCVGSCKDMKSLEKFFKSIKSMGVKIDRKIMEKLLVKPNEEIKFKPVFSFTDHGIFLEEYLIESDHQHRDSGISPICSSSTTTSSTLSSKVSMHSGEMADVSSLSSGKSNSCGIEIETSAHILSSQDISSGMFPKTSTQKSPKTIEFPEDFGANSKSKVGSKASPIVAEQPVKVTKSTKNKRNRKNIESTASDLSASKEPKNKKRKTKPKVKVLEEESVTESSKDEIIEEKPRKPTRRKKGMIIPDIKPEEIKALIENIGMSTEDESSMQEEANFGSILPGVKVMARWKDGYYYCGMVQSQEMDGKWAVLFEDGFLRTITPECLIKVAILPKGTSVLVQSPDDYYDPGIVCGHFREGNKVGYEVELDNGVTKRYPRSAVILSNDQAKLLLSNRPPTTPASMTINLDNIVDGKRKRKPVQSPLATSPVVKRVTRSKKHDSNLDTDNAVETSSVKSKDSETELPPSKKKKTTKKGAKETSTSAIATTSTAVASTSTSNVSKASRARPQRMVTLFKDYAFLLTNADRKPVPKPLPDTTDSDTVNSQEEDIVPFDKDELENHIASGGGIVLEKFDDIKKCTRKHIYLLANSYVRTMKYIQCIAAGICCIKHHWVQNCIVMSEILSLKSYILPAGYSIVTQQVIEWHGRTDIFKGCKIALVSALESPFVYTWAPVLLAAKADFVQKWSLPSSVSGSSLVVDVLITNNHCPTDIIESAVRRKIPIVSSEWIIQCLIMGKKLPYDSHPKFKHDYTEI